MAQTGGPSCGGGRYCSHIHIPFFNTTHLALPIIPASRDYGWKLAETSAAVGMLSLVVLRINLDWIVRGLVIFGSSKPSFSTTLMLIAIRLFENGTRTQSLVATQMTGVHRFVLRGYSFLHSSKASTGFTFYSTNPTRHLR